MPTPTWVSDAIFYQIFPDRFANGDPAINPPNMLPWNNKPTRRGFHGGDLRGIINKFDYLLDLGVTAIYLNPIFHAPTNHRYNAIDYMRIDPYLGDMKDFRDLMAVAKRSNVRVILDGVLNHCGREFFAFLDIVEKGEASEYKDWFFINKYPVKAYGRGKTTDYAAWWGIRDLPKLNTDNPKVRKYLFDMTRFWLDQGIDGWRLDVPNEIPFPFWEEYSEVVKAANADAYLVGEIWQLDANWTNGKRFDGLMNYPVRKFILEGLEGTMKPSQMARDAEAVMATYPFENSLVMYNLLASHDTKRVLTAVRGSVAKAKLAFAALFAFPGAPAVYYGDEVGMRGGQEPASRGGFPWDERHWNGELRQWVKKLVSLRKESAALRRGSYKTLLKDDGNGLFGFVRQHERERVGAVFNFSGEARRVQLPAAELKDGSRARDLLTGALHSAQGGTIEMRLPAWGAAYLSF
jgi:glycosidase